MDRIKDYNTTGAAPDGVLYAGDLNALQDAVAALDDLTQHINLASLALGESGLQIVRYGAGEARLTGRLRTDGYVMGLGGLMPGAFTTAARNAIPAGQRPTNLIIKNTDTGNIEINIGSDAVPNWVAITKTPDDAIAAHLADGSDAHDASAISYAGGTGMSAIDVEAAIDELATEKANQSALDAHTGDTDDAHDASAISYAGGTGMSATNVEAAIDELATEKANSADVPVIQGAWTSASPTLLGAGGNPTFGTGGSGGRYVKIGRTVHFKMIWRWVGGSSGSGVYTVVVPQGSQVDMTVGAIGLAHIGSGHIVLNDNSLVSLSVVAKDSDEFFLKYNSFGVETNLAAPGSVPVYLTISGTYETTA